MPRPLQLTRRTRSLFLVTVGLISACTRVSAPTTTAPPTLTVAASAVPPALAASPPTSDVIDPQVRRDLDEILRLQNLRTPAIEERIKYWDAQAGAIVRWNELARQLVTQSTLNPPRASRMYTLLSLAQLNALEAAWADAEEFQGHAPQHLDPSVRPLIDMTGRQVIEPGVLAGASSTVLLALFPDQADMITQSAKEQIETRIWAGASLRSDLQAGEALGQAVAQDVLEKAQSDGAQEAAAQIELPTGPDKWYLDSWQTLPAQMPGWGGVRPWFMASGDQFHPSPPPAFESPEFRAALAEARQISDTRTEEQSRIAAFWADGPGTATPPGHWNEIATDYIRRYGLDERPAAQVLTTVNMAMMDAGIACWEAKYKYFVIRPWQADFQVITIVGWPNHPSYPSGHSCFSGAAAGTLAYFFPDAQAELEAMAKEASLSRLYAGIHYRFDLEAGLEIGRKVGQLAAEYADAHGWGERLTLAP